jgi:uncharacterized protein YqgC (DUF456 family)
MNKKIIVALVCFVGSLALYLSLGTISEETARIFPRVVIVVMIVLSALLLIQELLVKRKGQKKGKSFPWSRFFLLLGIIIGYFVFMQSVGFYVSAFLFFVIVSFLLGRSDLTAAKGASRIFQSAVFTGVLFVLFKVLLKVQTPTGLLF